MHRAGEPVIAGDLDLLDRYYAVVAQDEPIAGRNPLVKVVAVIDYPIQHAIVWPDYANDNAPIGAGRIGRLAVLERLRALPALDYARSVDQARRRAMDSAALAGRQDILDILQRHARGEYGKARELCQK